MPTSELLNHIDWHSVQSQMHNHGYALVPGVLTHFHCADLIHLFNQPGLYRKTVVMEKHRYGLGEYKYFNYPLPNLIQLLREQIYPHLAPLANQWMEWLKIEKQFPATLAELRSQCHQAGQLHPTVLILKYGAGGYNALHQDLYGEVFFPMQIVFLLNQPGTDFTGGEFVLIQQEPRAQSKAIVLTPNLGDMIIFTTNFRPVKSPRGYRRAPLRHGVSQVHAGTRHTLGIIFHDALK